MEILSTFYARIKYISVFKSTLENAIQTNGPEKSPKSSPFHSGTWTSIHLIHKSLGRPHWPPETATRSLHALLHKYAPNSPLVTMGRPISTQKLPLSVEQPPTPITCLINGSSRSTTPNAMQIQSAVFPQCTGQSPTDRLMVQTTKPVPTPAYAQLMIATQLTTAVPVQYVKVIASQTYELFLGHSVDAEKACI